jgi:hypothetical protein
MKKLLSGVCAASLALAITVSGMLPSYAAPFVAPQPEPAASSNVIKVQSYEEVLKPRQRAGKELRRQRSDNRNEVRRADRRDRRDMRQADRRDDSNNRRDRREVRRDDNRGGYYRGHRGYRDYRPGYKRHGDYWYPAAAFVAGALISGAIANSQSEVVVDRDVGGSHEEWCANRYRSYRAYDDTFQPNNGPRRECISPFD